MDTRKGGEKQNTLKPILGSPDVGFYVFLVLRSHSVKAPTMTDRQYLLFKKIGISFENVKEDGLDVVVVVAVVASVLVCSSLMSVILLLVVLAGSSCELVMGFV